MKKIYWRPQKISKTVLFFMALLALVGLVLVEKVPHRIRQKNYQEKIEASRVWITASKEIKKEAAKRGIAIDPETDPQKTGLIGELMTVITSDKGTLEAKETSINPNFAGVIVDMLKKAGVKKGDTIAVGYSGSFPSLNIAVLSACKVLDLKPIIIASSSASQWGANRENFSWLEMEQALFDAGVFSFKSIATSVGGIDDRGVGMTKKGVRLLKEMIAKLSIPFIEPVDYADSVEKRMQIYKEKAGSEVIKAYINIGGGTSSVGKKKGKNLFKPGLNFDPPKGRGQIDSVMSRFIKEGIPVIHLVKINDLATKYGLSIAPKTLPEVGEGNIYYSEEYNPWLVTLVLASLFLGLYIFVHSDIGYRMGQIVRKKAPDKNRPERMV